MGWKRRGDEIPLLNLVKAWEERDGDEDDDCFFAVADFELWVRRERTLVCALPISQWLCRDFVHSTVTVQANEHTLGKHSPSYRKLQA